MTHGVTTGAMLSRPFHQTFSIIFPSCSFCCIIQRKGFFFFFQGVELANFHSGQKKKTDLLLLMSFFPFWAQSPYWGLTFLIQTVLVHWEAAHWTLTGKCLILISSGSTFRLIVMYLAFCQNLIFSLTHPVKPSETVEFELKRRKIVDYESVHWGVCVLRSQPRSSKNGTRANNTSSNELCVCSLLVS